MILKAEEIRYVKSVLKDYGTILQYNDDVNSIMRDNNLTLSKFISAVSKQVAIARQVLRTGEPYHVNTEQGNVTVDVDNAEDFLNEGLIFLVIAKAQKFEQGEILAVADVERPILFTVNYALQHGTMPVTVPEPIKITLADIANPKKQEEPTKKVKLRGWNLGNKRIEESIKSDKFTVEAVTRIIRNHISPYEDAEIDSTMLNFIESKISKKAELVDEYKLDDSAEYVLEKADDKMYLVRYIEGSPTRVVELTADDIALYNKQGMKRLITQIDEVEMRFGL